MEIIMLIVWIMEEKNEDNANTDYTYNDNDSYDIREIDVANRTN